MYIGGKLMDRKKHCNSMVESTYRNIQYYQDMIALSYSPRGRMYYAKLLNKERERLDYWKNYYSNEVVDPNQRIFTLEELAQYDGSKGKPAYIAVNTIVYDASLEATWGGGTHFSLYAGRDLTEQFMGCHGGRLEVLRNLPKVGILEE